MKPKPSSRPSASAAPEKFLRRALMKSGRYYQSGDLFYQRLWRDRLQAIGFRVYHVERLEHHPVWHIRLRATLTAQAYLLLSRPAKERLLSKADLLEQQVKAEVQRLGREIGPGIASDCLQLQRQGNYWRITFVWEAGRPGLWLQAPDKPSAFSSAVQLWLSRIRN